ncbi:MAG TPA: dihydrodipicolinate synthase family protein [Bryobacteraceae bacterium]|nr:dihydrodipicolinate synthase family protein [Bryobacteraceae bacterium]
MPYSLDKFCGIFPAALTMFDKENNLDEDGCARHWEWLIRQGVDGLVIAGTSGEFIALENQERLRLFQLAKEVCGGRVPLIFGSGHYSTKYTIEMSEAAEKLGADGIIVILPYYQKPYKPAVIRHYRDLRRAVDLPIMLYANPANSACVDLTPREIAQLVDEDVLHMVKATYETVVPIHDLRFLMDGKMAIFYGSFQAPFEAFAARADGWISGILNVAPKAAKAMYQATVIENDAKRGFEIWKRILPLVHLYTHQLVGPVSDLATYRSILNFWGLKGGYSRNPFYPLDREQEQRLRGLLEKSGWLDPEQALASTLECASQS